jgi:hypothetical protein
MRTQWESVWEFNTARFRIVAEVTPCEDDPADSFDFDSDIEAVRNGDVAWFDARVRILMDGECVGADYLGCCAYSDPLDLFRHHSTLTRQLRRLRGRTDRKSRRERKALRQCLSNNAMLDPPVIYCEYGPSMVLQAISEARATLARHGAVKLRQTESV